MSEPVSKDFVVVMDKQTKLDSLFPQLQVNIADFEDIEPALTNYTGIILDSDSHDFKRRFLEYLRSHSHLCLSLVYITSPSDSMTEALADGLLDNPDHLLQQAAPIISRLRGFEYDIKKVLTNHLFRVILYYYTRDAVIEPIKDWEHPAIYAYPLIEKLTGLSDSTEEWLGSQAQRLLLEKEKLIDRLRICPHCSLANPNFVDVCTNCRSIHIHQDTFLHCFTCGAVQPEKDFQTSAGEIVCPQCSQRLRHIGTDYDRPLENYTCSDCHSTFSEPLIIAVCPRCDTATETEDLELRLYYSYSLTEKAIMAAQMGQLREPTALIDDLQNVSFQHFTFQLDWFFAMARRYEHEIFTVFALRLINLKELETAIGSARLFELMEEFVKRVRKSLRSTDFSARGMENDLWVLLPKTDMKQRETVLNRILEFAEETGQVKEDALLKMNVAALTVPTQTAEHDTSEKVVALLDNDLSLK